MSEKKKVKINGFVFTDEAEAEQAKKEAHGIHYVEERADMHHPETVSYTHLWLSVHENKNQVI